MKNPDFEKPADANKNNVYEVAVVVTDSGRLTDTLAVRVEVTNAEGGWRGDLHSGHAPGWGAADRHAGGPRRRRDGPRVAMDGCGCGGRCGEDRLSTVQRRRPSLPATEIVAKLLSVKVKYTDGKGKDEVTEGLEDRSSGIRSAAVLRQGQHRSRCNQEGGNRSSSLKLMQRTRRRIWTPRRR